MTVNGTITKTEFADEPVNESYKIGRIHIEELRQAITRLQAYGANVDNCGNCVYCQSCQEATCQETSCQSASCQSVSCQSCQSYSCQKSSNCNCDCSDDS